MQAPKESSTTVSDADRQLVTAAYEAFNARELDALLATVHPDVVWPRSQEGGYLQGHAQVWAYWTQQWAKLRTVDRLVEMHRLSDGRTGVLAQQTVHDYNGNLVHAGPVYYVYTIREGLIQRMEIQAAPSPGG